MAVVQFLKVKERAVTSTNACKPAINTSGMDKTKVPNCQSYQVLEKSFSAVVNGKITLNMTEEWGEGTQRAPSTSLVPHSTAPTYSSQEAGELG